MAHETISLKFISNLESALAGYPGVFNQLQTLFKLPKDVQAKDRIEVVKFIHLFQVIQQDHGVTNIGYLLGEHYTPAQMGVLGLYLQTCNTLKEAIHHYLEYSYLDSEFETPLHLSMDNNTFSITLTPPPELLAIQQTYAIISANRIIKAIQYFCAPDVTPIFIASNLNAKEEQFNQTINLVHTPDNVITLTYANQTLTRKLPGRDPSLNKLLKQEIDKKVAEARPAGDLVSAVIRQVAKSEQLANLSLSTIAFNLAMSERTLSRKLNLEDVQLKEILRQAKRQHAIKQLAGGADIADVAVSLGFSDRSSFERAFKSWTAFTPAKFKDLNQTIPNLAQQNFMAQVDSLAAISNIQGDIELSIQAPHKHQKSMADIIVRDPVLSAKIYGLSQLINFNAYPIPSIDAAVERLYTSDITRGMCHAIINNSFIEKYAFTGIKLQEHWMEVFVMAEFCKAVICQKHTSSDWNEAEIYLLGLTCHIGFIFLLKNQPENMASVFSSYDLTNFQSLAFSQAIEKQCDISAFMATALIMIHWGFPLKFVKILINMGSSAPSEESKDTVNLLRCADEIAYHTTVNNEKMALQSIEDFACRSSIDLHALTKIYKDIKSRYKIITNNHRFSEPKPG